MKIRRFVASLASAIGGVALYHDFARNGPDRVCEKLFMMSLVVVPVIAAAVIWLRPIAAQLLARATWWSLLLVGAVMALFGDSEMRSLGGYIAVCNATALIAAGNVGLDARTGRFVPVAFRGTLIVSLVLAIADTGSFLWFGLGTAVFEHRISLFHRVSMLMLVPFMITGVIGLLRLRVWGLLVSLATNLLIATLAFTRVLPLPDVLRQLFIGTAVLQLLVPIPMLVAFVRGRAPDPARWARAKAIAPLAIVAVIAAVSAYSAFVRAHY
jgi:hypothetical protein